MYVRLLAKVCRIFEAVKRQKTQQNEVKEFGDQMLRGFVKV